MRMVKSVICTEFGGIDKIEVKEIPLRKLNDNDLEIEVHYCGLNFADLYTRLGLFPKDEKPFILGIECSGIVKNVGTNITDFKVNDRVVCYDYQGGLHRSTVVLPPKNCYLIPDLISLKAAASAFVAFLTAHCCLFEIGNLSPGQNIFVHSSAGSVGAAAVQLAKTIPQVKIWGTTSDSNKITSNSVDHVLTYDNYLEKVPKSSIDIFIDNQAGKKYTDNIILLKPFGKLIVTGANYMVGENELNQSTSESFDILPKLIMESVCVGGLHLGKIVQHTPEQLKKALDHIWALLIANKVKAHLDSVWSFDSNGVRNATSLLQNRKNKAKVLLKTHHAIE